MRRLLLVPLLLAYAIPASADTITIDFNDPAQAMSLCWSCVYTEQGFRVSVVTGHYDLLDGDIIGDQVMTVDNFSAFDTSVRLDRFGAIFDLLSLDIVSVGLFEGTGAPGDVASITASDGRRIDVTTAGLLSLNWSNLSWVELGVYDPTWDWPGCDRCASGGQDVLSFDNIVVRAVPEPSTLALIALGSIWLRRRRPQELE